MNIKPIDTRYGGYLFRSRLEARWAVFFDSICTNAERDEWLKWDYEAQGFDLPSGPYLPDFYMPDYHTFVEIKPDKGGWVDEFNLGREMVAEDPSAEFVMFFGDPVSAVFNKSAKRYQMWSPNEKPRLVGVLDKVRSFTNFGAARAREARFEHGARP